VLYALGLAGMALSPNAFLFTLTAGRADRRGAGRHHLRRGVRRDRPPDRPGEKRSWAMGVAAAAGSFGQFLMVPVEGFLISGIGWQQALLVLAGIVLLVAPLAIGLREAGFAGGAAPAKREQTILPGAGRGLQVPELPAADGGLLRLRLPGGVHRRAHAVSYLKDKGLSPQVASYALALIGLFNVFGTYIAGTLGQKLAKRKILATIYLGRAVAIAVFLWAPLSPLSVYIFAAVMGLLWLSTVPPTNATMAQIFGVAHLSMLGGFVFFSHQIGSFLGVWLGGYLYDRTGSYDIVWYISIALGVFAALVNLPVREAPISRGRRAAGGLRWPKKPMGAVAVLLAVFALYTRPQMMVALSHMIWACF
jgi:hypothetical protein